MNPKLILASIAVLALMGMSTYAYASSTETRPALCQTYPGNCVTMTQTVAINAIGAPFYDVYADGQPVISPMHPTGQCYTPAEKETIALNYPNIAGIPNPNCHGVPN